MGCVVPNIISPGALQIIDALLCPLVEGAPSPEPPPSPIEGQCFIVAGSADGAWAGKDGCLAAFTDGGWRFVAPREGLSAVSRSSGETLLYRDGGWEAGIVRAQEVRIGGQVVVRGRQPAIAPPAGGTTMDAECRVTITALLAALQAHGLIG